MMWGRADLSYREGHTWRFFLAFSRHGSPPHSSFRVVFSSSLWRPGTFKKGDTREPLEFRISIGKKESV